MSKKLTVMRLQGDMTEYKGRTPETIAKRLYGKTAIVQPSADPNSPTWGQILSWNRRASAYDVLAVIVTCDCTGYRVECRETGDIIENWIGTLDEARKIVEGFEETDRKEGNYTPRFYAICDIETGELVE